ncbi:LacI family DNA-binding transcriptional regulator [Rugosimonospora africana]|uniref:LacI family transcriptional regulator n=1 Tax=Rugosimonospora africana TaxID=556532 RepID=A0A8J3VUH4_9ACTN|nr:LacI family DNA-binding transcriptional regulator [Rugosimonospora africana]GIH18643.1 LacI family transcriptional regulator [Rugosimonospora africana]
MSTPMGNGAGPHRPTMADVARVAGVSLKTVSRVVNHVPTVDPALVEKVLAAVSELGFRRNDMARNLRSRSTSGTVGLLIEDLANPFYSAIAAAAAECAIDHDAMLITASSEEDGERERRLLLSMCERRVDGLLVVPAAEDQGYLRTEIEIGTPVVFLDRPPTNLRADTVLIDNEQGAREAIEYLVAKGHERIGVLSDWLRIYTMRQRLSAAEAALERAGVPYRPDLIRDGLHTIPDTEAAVERMLDSDQPPTALFALNNRLTLGALGVLNRRRSDVALVGFDDFETAALMPHPLTIVSHDAGELGRVGAELLFRRIAGEQSRPQTVVVPTRLVERSAG